MRAEGCGFANKPRGTNRTDNGKYYVVECPPLKTKFSCARASASSPTAPQSENMASSVRCGQRKRISVATSMACGHLLYEEVHGYVLVTRSMTGQPELPQNKSGNRSNIEEASYSHLDSATSIVGCKRLPRIGHATCRRFVKKKSGPCGPALVSICGTKQEWLTSKLKQHSDIPR